MSNVLTFLMKMWCQSHLWGLSSPNVMIQLIIGSLKTPNIMMKCFIGFWMSFALFFYIKYTKLFQFFILFQTPFLLVLARSTHGNMLMSYAELTKCMCISNFYDW